MNKSEAKTLIQGGNASERSIKESLELYGVKVPGGITVSVLPPSVDLKFPVALKVSDPQILHKTDVGGVRIGIRNYGELKEEFNSMSKRFPGRNFLIEEMADSGLEVIIGVLKDANFGHAIMLGMGGIYTELYHDVVFRLLPIDRTDAGEMIDSVGIRKFTEGFRGMKISKRSLEDLLLSVSDMVTEIGEGIEQLDLNPVILSEKNAVVADAKLISGGSH